MAGEVPRAYALPDQRLSHGEILTDLVELVAHRDGDEFAVEEVSHPFVVVLTQDCDLEQDAKARADSSADASKRAKAMLSCVLLVVASKFDTATDFGGSDIKRRAKSNKDERYHFMSAVPAELDQSGEGLPALVLDFKRYFTCPLAELLKTIDVGSTKKRSRLASPYSEHLSNRFGYFLQRVALPKDHHDFEGPIVPG